MDDTINVAFILRKEARSRAAVSEVEEIARGLGMKPTGSGAATVSLAVPLDVFEALFGGRPESVPSQEPGEADSGAPGGYVYEAEIPIPEELADFLESISVEPPARRLFRF